MLSRIQQRRNPHQTFLNDPDDIRWLREVHIPDLDPSIRAAVLYGTEDYPYRVDAYTSPDPDVDDACLVYIRYRGGKLHTDGMSRHRKGQVRQNAGGISAKRLERDLGISAQDARRIHGLMTDASSHRKIDAVLDAADAAMNATGVEAVRGDWHDHYYQNIVLLYVNTGDSYDTTLLYDTADGRFLIGSVGDWIERYGDEAGVE